MNLPKHISSKKGFTLIELLIVIGILGILAAGLLAAVDPLEQLRKGRDTSKRNVAIEVYNANARYFATRGSMPWGTGSYGSITLASMGAGGAIGSLVLERELKQDFNAGLDDSIASSLYLYGQSEAIGGSVFVCFRPESRDVRQDDAIYQTWVSGTGMVTGVQCPNATSSNCWYCAR